MAKKTARLTNMLLLIKSRGKVTARFLAQEFEVSERTIHRDMDELLLWGVPLISDSGPGGGYSLPEQYSVEPDMFTVEETIVLSTGSTAIQIFSDFWETPFTSELLNAKLLAVLSDQERDLVNKHIAYIYFDRSRWYRTYTLQKTLKVLKNAVIYDRQVLIDYFDRDEDIETGSPKSSRVDPYGLVFKSDTWYLGGFCHELKKMKRWNITRIADAKLTHYSFSRPKNFVLKDWWEQGLEEFGSGKNEVVISINKLAWYRFRRFKWKVDDRVEMREDDVLVYMRVDKFDWLIDLVLVNRGDVIVLKPVELQEKIIKISHHLYKSVTDNRFSLLDERNRVDFEILSLSDSEYEV